ncbi:nuclease-related domain-containing protein [Pseudomonas viridiflava]|uniref:nuclease-related domain-containing protein n=1 Tax=Pseudomonas viridiflava TaxID=33069 RepID=UPI000F03797E|nr:nuclease-related domain-containing protein [Pseudomonas viridiflava]
MNYTAVFGPALNMLIWLVPAVLFVAFLKSPWAKGQIGEFWIRLFTYWKLDRAVYRRLHNVTLDTADGTTQIDHVFISPFGIFVLETKNMSGWIFGGEKQPQWTQKIYRRTYKFQNPLRQNYKHLKALETTLGVSLEHIHSVVSFVGESTFKTAMPANVTQGIGYIPYIRSFQQPVFSDVQVDILMQTLLRSRRAPTRATHREHVQNLKRRR